MRSIDDEENDEICMDEEVEGRSSILNDDGDANNSVIRSHPSTTSQRILQEF